MPRRPRNEKRRSRRLTMAQEMDLILGRNPRTRARTPFADEVDRRAAWFQHRDRLMRDKRVPAAYWDHEIPGTAVSPAGPPRPLADVGSRL